MRSERLVTLFFFCLFVVFIVYALVNDAYATERNSRNHSDDINVNGGDVEVGVGVEVGGNTNNNSNTNTNTNSVTNMVDVGGTTMNAGDVNVSNSSKSFAFAHGLGDVDINQCIVTKQTGTFVLSWQGYDYNLWCMGEVFDAKGLYHMGAEMRCDIKPIASKFDTREACLMANTVSAMAPAEVTQALREHEEIEEEYEYRLQVQESRLNDMQMLLEQSEDKAPAVRIIEKPLLSEKQRKALAEVLAE